MARKRRLPHRRCRREQEPSGSRNLAYHKCVQTD
jgi:hypothetical protein